MATTEETRQIPSSTPRAAGSTDQPARLLSRAGLLSLGKELINAFTRADAMGLSKQVAYSVIFALLPTMFLIVATGAVLEHFLHVPITRELRTSVVEYFPADVQPFLLDLLDDSITRVSAQAASLSAVVALGLAIWGGMNGIGTLVEATNRAYGVRNTRPFLDNKAMAAVMTFAFTASLALSIVARFFSGRVVDRLAETFGEESLIVRYGSWAQGLVAVVVVIASLLTIYRFGPTIDQSIRWLLPGTLFSASGWFVLLELFGRLVDRLALGGVYGAASSLVIALYLLNYSGLIFIIGALLNGVLGARYDPRRKADLQMHPAKIRYLPTGQEIRPPTLR